MANKQFILTYRKEDLYELYHAKLEYKLFSSANYPALLLVVLCLALASISLIKTISNDQYLFLSLCFLFGAGYQTAMILKHYLNLKEENKNTESWIASINDYKLHSLEFGESSFKYKRDNDVFVYDLNNVKSTYRTDNYLYFATMDDLSITLSKKSFAPGEYEQFLSLFDEKSKL